MLCGRRLRGSAVGLILTLVVEVLVGLIIGTGGGALLAKGQSVDMDKIFPPSDPPETRDLLLQTCSTSCHSFVPLVVGRKTAEEWTGTFDRHRPQVEPFGLTEEQIAAMLKYLQANFDPEKPIPELPPELLQGWATQ